MAKAGVAPPSSTLQETCVYPGCAADLKGRNGFLMCTASALRHSHIQCPDPGCRSPNRAYVQRCTKCGKPLSYAAVLDESRRRFQIAIPMFEVLKDSQRAYRKALQNTQAISLCVGYGYLLLCTKRAGAGQTQFRLLILDPETGTEIHSLPLPGPLVGSPAMGVGRRMLMATRTNMLALDLDSMKLAPLSKQSTEHVEFVQSPFFAGAWYVVALANSGRSGCSVYRVEMEGEASVLVPVKDLPGRPQVVALRETKAILLSCQGGAVLSPSGARGLPEGICLPCVDPVRAGPITCDGEVWYCTDDGVARLTVETEKSTLFRNVQHLNGRLTVSDNTLLVADANGMRRYSLVDVIAGSGTPATLDTRLFALPATCFGRYAAGASSDGVLGLYYVDTGGPLEHREFPDMDLPCAPTFFNGFLYVLTAFRNRPDGELHAFRLST